jgi:predicted RNA-binding protein with RPS1 domain
MINQPSEDTESPKTSPAAHTESTPTEVKAVAQAPTAAQTAPQEPQAAPPARAPYVSREERDRRRREALTSLVIGEWREGKVTGIAAFGAFVDLGGVDGLVHVSQLGTGGYVERVEDVVQVGQVVRVRVAEVDTDRGRVSLSMREARPTAAPQRDSRPAPATSPRPARPATSGGAPGGFTPSWTPDTAPELRPDRRSRSSGGGERHTFANRDERPAKRSERPRRGGDDEEWRSVRGDPRNYYSFSEEAEDEPAPTTAEELVARFGRKESSR